jgi:sodium-dependent phosphate transporter
MSHYESYTWLFALSTIVSFICAFGIGANDVANSFASSVGAKALTMVQALMVAAVCEFLGALLLGAGVTDTVRSKIANVKLFTATPDLLMYGMFCVMCAAAFWDNFACHLELPVSTTHTTVGAVVGMALVLRGGNAVVWSKHKATFVYLDGMVPIFLSWVVSPICSGIVAIILFGLVRTFVLRSKQSFWRALIVFPLSILLTFFVVVVFIIQTGNKNKKWHTIPDGKLCWIAAIVAIGMALLACAILPFMKRRIMQQEADFTSMQVEEGQRKAAMVAEAHGEDLKASKLAQGQTPAEVNGTDGKAAPVAGGRRGLADVDIANAAAPSAMDRAFNRVGKAGGAFAQSRVGRILLKNPVSRAVGYGATYDVHNVLDDKHNDFNNTVAQMWEHAEVFDYKSERVFRYLQVFSAMVMSFAHGSNDVANAVGPYAAVYNIWNTSSVPTSSTVPTWILALGGAGIVCGLATYGYKIMRVLGVKSVKLTNSRGFCVELSTAITVIVASRYGLPVSTTQVLTGAILAVGLFEGVKGVNWFMFARIFCGWALTLVVAGFVAAGLTAFGAYAPNKFASDDFVYVDRYLLNNTNLMLRDIQRSTAGAANSVQIQSINSTYTALNKAVVRSHPNVARNNAAAFALFNGTQCLTP